ncbi:MAG: VWA domain-containing protein [bacterium]
MRTLSRGIMLLLAALLLGACVDRNSGGAGSGTATGRGGSFSGVSLSIISGSENEGLEPLIQRFAADNGASISMQYKGSVDIMLELAQGSGMPYDAVWPANSLWISLGDSQRVVKHSESIMRSPVVLGVKHSVAERLGWVGSEVRVQDILDAAEAGQLRFGMTSATQSNSGASAYIGYLYAFAGQPEVLTLEQLDDPQLQDRIRRILGSVQRSSGSSGWLKDSFLERFDSLDAMVNYEALVIEANQELQRRNMETLYAVYPVDGLVIADSPLGFVSKGDSRREELFLALQEYLLSPEVQQEILAAGRRTGLLGLNPESVDRSVFNPDWGIDATRTISPIRFPAEDVLRRALDLYQVTFRKPSFTVYALDYSGSMEGEGLAEMKRAMRTLLDSELSTKYLLQPTDRDVSVVIPFDDRLLAEWVVNGNDPQALSGLLDEIEQFAGGGNTNIYAPVARGVELIRELGGSERHFPAVILLTDGQSNEGSFSVLRAALDGNGMHNVPVFSIVFGAASEEQLQEISDYTGGRVFDGKKDLVKAFRQAKGYN